jgi:glucosamine--fructose-6-phosphate aminotransferase (isomerizing)
MQDYVVIVVVGTLQVLKEGPGAMSFMCGIVACVGSKDAGGVLLGGLKRVEYRGYDSAGIATLDEGRLKVRKGIGRIAEIDRKYKLGSIGGIIGIAHTRWATHGGVTEPNAHPQTSCKEKVAIVHNGIIENYIMLKKQLKAKGHRFKSQTDSEVIAHLLEDQYGKTGDPVQATISTAKKLRGQYAFVAMFQDQSDLITGARKDAPLILGISRNQNFLASDVLAFIEHTDKTIFLENFEIGVITSRGAKVYDLTGKEIKRMPTQVAWELGDASKLDYAHFTLKEIHEQPATVVAAFAQDPEKLERFARLVRKARSVFITGSGTSFHAALVLKYRLNTEVRLRCEAVVAGELKQHSDFIDEDSVVIALSQSGETADVLEAVKLAQERSAKVLSIVNGAGSTLARHSDAVLLLNCGPEVGVAATKSFTAQLTVNNQIVDALLEGKTQTNRVQVSQLITEALESETIVKKLARTFKNSPDVYFIGRGIHYPIALEGALKLKELSYLHAEGMAASELKHGTLALIEKGTPVVALNPKDGSYQDMLSSIEELRARGAEVIGVSTIAHPAFSYFLKMPASPEKITPLLEVVPLQLLAYYVATEREHDPDYPRNLAKSVTVK